MTATNSSISVSLLLSVLCLGLVVIFVGGWYFQSSLVDLKAEQQETAKVMQQLKEKMRRQNKQLSELQLQLEQVSPSSTAVYSYCGNLHDIQYNNICMQLFKYAKLYIYIYIYI